jgi:MYXO-CTERM domain-containing protein
MYAVAGYGMTDDEDQASAGNLTEGESGLDQIGDHEIEAGNGDAQQACHGDSGGPIFADDSDTLQIGIASRLANADLTGGQPRCNTGLLYTRIDMYQSWLTDHVSDLGQGGDGDDDMDDDGMDGDDDTTDDGDDDGGGCTVGGNTAGFGGALALFLAAIAIGLRRRRQSAR